MSTKKVAIYKVENYNDPICCLGGSIMTKRANAAPIALGGVFAALAVVVMSVGGLIPAATFVCPMLCILMLSLILKHCGSRIAWAWYGAVAILSVLLGPDKEAAAVFLFLGYYPILKPKMDTMPWKWLWKGIFFNLTILVMYWLLINLLGMAELIEEFGEMDTVMTLATLALGNVTFFLLDLLLTRGGRIRFINRRK